MSLSNLYNYSSGIYHRYHLVDPSPWPLVAALAALATTVGATMYFHSFSLGFFLMVLGIFDILIVMGVWFRDVIREGTYQGKHTKKVQVGLRIGMLLFIVSEVMFFFAFFWAFFHSSLSPAIQIGSVWPPAGIVTFNAWGVPFLNTYILLLSGATITAAHHFILSGRYGDVVKSMTYTILLAVFFTVLQAYEYMESPFTISDGIYGSTFFMATGFHGLHVIIGTTFITVCLIRAMFGHFTREHHFGFEAAAWYWHFVDVVWLFLFVSIYWWGSL